jgi:hypothetical protein
VRDEALDIVECRIWNDWSEGPPKNTQELSRTYERDFLSEFVQDIVGGVVGGTKVGVGSMSLNACARACLVEECMLWTMQDVFSAG